jgi:hypothetical protein
VSNGVEWEMYQDEAYYGMWAVRPVQDRAFESPRLFHFADHADALGFLSLVRRSHHAIPKLYKGVHSTVVKS